MAKLKPKSKKMKILLITTVLLAQSLSLYGTNNNSTNTELLTNNLEGRQDTYESYLQTYQNAPMPVRGVKIPITEYISADPKVKVLERFEGESQVVRTEEEGYVEWEFDVPDEGWYYVKMDYYPVEGRSSQIERKIEINGSLPFFDATHILFSRVWGNQTAVEQDNRENDLRPRQVENPKWQSDFFKDSMGYYTEPYQFYFKKGKNTLKLTSIREPLVIKAIELCSIQEIPTYDTVKAEYEKLGYESTKGHVIKIQGEDAQYKSDPTLYPLADRASPITEPYHPSKIRMNMIGAEQWKLPGQWIEWEIEIPEDGLYEIVLKERQDMLRGSFANRKLTIDGNVPFQEVESIPFKFQKEWRMNQLGNEEPYLFYLEKGTHQIRLEVSLGELGSILNTVENSIFELNKVYRSILMLTGPSPDT
ncbi:MAG: hypothetical protein ACRDBA_06815, partial [Clostridium sp.]